MQPMTPSLNTSAASATKSLVATAPCKSTFAPTQVGELHAQVTYFYLSKNNRKYCLGCLVTIWARNMQNLSAIDLAYDIFLHYKKETYLLKFCNFYHMIQSFSQ